MLGLLALAGLGAAKGRIREGANLMIGGCRFGRVVLAFVMMYRAGPIQVPRAWMRTRPPGGSRGALGGIARPPANGAERQVGGEARRLLGHPPSAGLARGWPPGPRWRGPGVGLATAAGRGTRPLARGGGGGDNAR